MIRQTIFRPTDVTGADGWTETGTPSASPQPPNRALPAPIFDDGTSYSPHNGALGNWVIAKSVFSDVAGPGFLVIPPGLFPSGGGLFADDVMAAVRVNGVAAPFTGSGGNWPPQSVPVTWLAGLNTVEIEVANTVAGNTSLAGRLVAQGQGAPCDCCPSGPARCALVEAVLDGPHTEVFPGGPGIALVGGTGNATGLARWSDADTSGGNFTGYTSPGVQFTSATSPVIDLSFATPHDGVRGLREWNQGGADLNDFDGFLSWTYEFFAGATSLATGTMTMGNGGTPFTTLLPGGQELNGVTRVRLSDMRKLNPGAGVSPLTREVRVVEVQEVFPCRRPSGALEWHTESGDLVSSADVIDCPVRNPLIVADLTVAGVAFNFAGDGSGSDEGMLIAPAAASVSTGTVQVSPGLYHASTASPGTPCGGKRMDLTYPPGSSFDFAYQGVAGAAIGGVFIQLVAPSLGGALNFGTFATGAWLPGQSKTIAVPGGAARLTYLSGPVNGNAPAGQAAPQCSLGSAGQTVIQLHLGSLTTADQPLRFNIAFTAA